MPSPTVREAQRLRNLGFYPQAEVKFREAIAGEDGSLLRVEFASMLMEQGIVKVCREELQKIRETGMEMPAIGEMLLCGANAFGNLAYSESLSTARALYTSHLQDRRPEEYEKSHVSMLTNYLSLVGSAALCGVDTTSEPLPSLGFLHSLFDHFLHEKIFFNAYSIAQEYASRAVPSKATLLLEELLAVLGSNRPGKDIDLDDKALNNIVLEADVACELVDWLRSGNRFKECRSLLDTAVQLYTRAGHAYGASMVKLYRVKFGPARSAKPLQRQRGDIRTIKEQFQKLQYLGGVQQALVTLHELAQAERDLELVLAVELEMRENGKLRGNRLDGFLQASLNIKYWTTSSSVTAQMLQTCEELYRDIVDVEVPAVRLLLAKDLVDGYKSIGDTARAAHWQTLVEQEPVVVPIEQQFLLGRDHFFQSLARQTSPPLDPDLELGELHQELKRIEWYTDPESLIPKNLHFGIMKVILMTDHYLLQEGFRGLDACEVRVKACLDSSDRLISVLPENDKLHWRAQAVQRQARMQSTRAMRQPSDQIPAILGLLLEATKQYGIALAMYRKAGSKFEAAMVLQNLQTCYRMTWQLQGRQQHSPLFGKAVHSLEEAARTLATHGTIAAQRTTKSFLLDIWYDGLFHNVQYGKLRPLWKVSGVGIVYAIGRLVGLWQCLPQRLRNLWPIFFSTPYEESIKALEQTEALIDEQRQDLSSLPSQEAIKAKQHLRKNVTKVFQTAAVIFGLAGQNKLLWESIQRSKARSVSDLLGIGDHISADLMERINADPDAVSLLEAEKLLGQHMENTAGIEKFTARRQLDQHRQRMRKNTALAELLELREGKPVNWERLRKIKTIDTQPKSRATWFIDWIIAEGSIFVSAISDQQEEYHIPRVAMTVDAVREWINNHMMDASKKPLKEPLNTSNSLPALIQLRPLVAPITAIVPEGDRLVLCPTDILHRVPLHAAITRGEMADDEDEWKRWQTLMERNPLVYTSSMTIYEQTMVRRAARRRSPDTTDTPPAVLRGAVLGVYEDPPPEEPLASTSWTWGRDEVYASCNSISSLMGWPPARCGNTVRHAQFRDALAAADILYFCGHFDYQSDNVLEHGMILGKEALDTTQDNQEQARERIFTTSDFFSNTSPNPPLSSTPTRINASHVSLIACGSARQAIQPEGDEPLGVVTGLLYAGATSVTGTMWPTAVGAGREFSRLFYRQLEEAQAKANASREREEKIDMAVLLQKTVWKMKRSAETSRPYSWAGFVLHGSWCL
ncbi:CHAT domain-containing protein [Apodospora peruviana]|uniref:CHAT domain-containing protein n=1 Tax=Apodospora peruviana TaxID=516989 RepID=A0AAE0HTL5_9PEZI|nr:CHAT domain-containing protein [Apodospora peruviana]